MARPVCIFTRWGLRHSGRVLAVTLSMDHEEAFVQAFIVPDKQSRYLSRWLPGGGMMPSKASAPSPPPAVATVGEARRTMKRIRIHLFTLAGHCLLRSEDRLEPCSLMKRDFSPEGGGWSIFPNGKIDRSVCFLC